MSRTARHGAGTRWGVAAAAGSMLLVGAGAPTAAAAEHEEAGDLGRAVLAEGDGWGSFVGPTSPNDVDAQATGTTGGSAATQDEVYVVDTWQELRDALAGAPGGSQTDARTSTTPRIIYVDGVLDAYTAADGTALSCDDFAAQVTVEGTGEPFSMDDYIAHFDPAGPWGRAAPSGPLEEARQAASSIQAAQIQQHVGSNVTIVGLGDDAGIVGANLRIRDAHNVILRNLHISEASDCFPEWDPGDTDEGNWNSAYDNVSILSSYSVWIDHNTFDDGDTPPGSLPDVYGRHYEIHDGLLDITNGADLVTVSWNVFDDHDKTMLIGSSDSRTQDLGEHRVTLHHNLWRDIGQRAPRVRYGDVHVYNNLYEQTDEGLFSYYWGAGVESSLYAENNAFVLADGVDPGRIIADWGGTRLHEHGSEVNGEPVDVLAAFNATADEPLLDEARWDPAEFYDVELLPTSDVAAAVEAFAGAGVLSPAPAPEFVDVTPSNPFYPDIRWLAENRLSTGTPVGDEVFFYPASAVSRQATAAFLYRYAGDGWVPEPGTQSFSDVDPDHPFYVAVEWLVATGIADGYPDGTFGATMPVSRQAMAAFLHRLAGEPQAAGTASYGDVPPGHPFAEAIAWLDGARITTGYDADTFGPGRPVTRQAMAAFLHRFDQFLFRPAGATT
ncbi:S-layer homology domain-containing protein [uncultured Cellulomonas sp.]|uniref:pectate lyase family protein n=1 Tax=uncultured Cellulomonas sp. TaxID=189682 RepID=UPI0026063282|nr:S-layer homology domain-containing protein [uncultured Cellulomonas sp.]